MLTESCQSVEIGTCGLRAEGAGAEVFCHSGDNVSGQLYEGSIMEVCLVCLSDMKNTRMNGAMDTAKEWAGPAGMGEGS